MRSTQQLLCERRRIRAEASLGQKYLNKNIMLAWKMIKCRDDVQPHIVPCMLQVLTRSCSNILINGFSSQSVNVPPGLNTS